MAEDGDGVYEAHYFGKSCYMSESWPEPSSYYPQGEDCLTLNIWRNQSNLDAKNP